MTGAIMAFDELSLNTQPAAKGFTAALAERAAGQSLVDVPERAQRIASTVLLDWYAVSMAGLNELPLRILRDEILANGGAQSATLLGQGCRTSVPQAALFAGTASHVLDYNDINMVVPHPSISVAAAVLATGEAVQASGADTLNAFIVGYETTCTLAKLLAPHMYDRGWQSSALGAIGSATACARLLGLNASGIELAMAIGAAQSNGIQGNSGSMLKCLNAGLAAQAGVTAASLAARGFDGNRGILERKKGFFELYANLRLPDATLPERGEDWHLYRALFKAQACCFLNHAALQAWQELSEQHAITRSDVLSVRVTVEGNMHRIVFTPPPGSDLQAKLNLRFCMAMAMHGVDTAAPASYNAALTQRSELHDTAKCVEIAIDPSMPATQARMDVMCRDGRHLTHTADVGVPVADLGELVPRVERKARMLLHCLPNAEVTSLIQRFHAIHKLPSIADIHPRQATALVEPV